MDIRNSIIIFLAICILFFLITFIGSIEWNTKKIYESFENKEQPTAQDFKDCEKNGYNYAELGKDNKVYCSLNELDNIKNASTQKCVLAIRGEGTLAPGEFFCDNENEKRNAIQRLYAGNTANDDEVYGSCKQGKVDYSLSTPIMKFCDINGKKCYKPPIEGVSDGVISRYLQHKDKEGNIKACPDCPPGMIDGGVMKDNPNVFICNRRHPTKKDEIVGDISVNEKSGLKEIFGNISNIPTNAVYYANSLEPVNIGKYTIRKVTIRPWGSDNPMTITSAHTQASELYNYNPEMEKMISMILPFTVQYKNRNNKYTVFLGSTGEYFFSIRGHKNIPVEEQSNYEEIYKEERKIAAYLQSQRQINNKIRNYSYNLIKDGDFRQAIRDRGFSRISYQVPVRVRRGLSIFRRRSRRYKTVYVTKYKLVRIQDLEDEDKKKKAVDDYIYRYEKMLNKKGKYLFVKAKQLYKRMINSTHNKALERIRNMYLALVLRMRR